MHWELLYILQGIQHDMELSMSYAGKDMTFVHDPRKGRDKTEPKRLNKFVSMNGNKESINVNVSLVKFIMKESKKQSVKITFRECSIQESTLREMQEKEYHFLYADVSEILMTCLILSSLSFKR
uniref:Uncharacterized protein n=1 Tax=Solanum tuberosum TaxID=4113 RepID=M1DZ82_SOLTU